MKKESLYAIVNKKGLLIGTTGSPDDWEQLGLEKGDMVWKVSAFPSVRKALLEHFTSNPYYADDWEATEIAFSDKHPIFIYEQK